ncbi:MAG: hypothetical protein JW787_04300 [Sedimentisphaerales bacterium]|nr:hypothetical protein [Sedimentisphaerales bacterium]
MTGKKKHVILGVHITDRIKHVPGVQDLLTEYGCNIKTRIGLHEVDGKVCSMNGLLILELVGDTAKCKQLGDKLNAIEGVEVQQMIFDHD